MNKSQEKESNKEWQMNNKNEKIHDKNKINYDNKNYEKDFNITTLSDENNKNTISFSCDIGSNVFNKLSLFSTSELIYIMLNRKKVEVLCYSIISERL